MSLPPPLRFCAGCADQADACQKTDWSSGGHKKACKEITRARHDTNLEVQSRALARVAHMSGGAPNDACYLFCLDRVDTAQLVWGCACRGTFGWTHMGCLVKCAEAARSPPPG